MRLPLDLEPGCHVMTADHRMHRVVDRPTGNGDWVCVAVRDPGEAQNRQVWLRRNIPVLTRTGQEQADLIKQEFGFDYMPRFEA